MFINEIRIKKFRHIENEVIGPLSQSSNTSDLIVLAGPNGGGKSSILELIGYALSNSYSLGWSLSRTFADFSFEIGISLSKQEIEFIVGSLHEDIAPALNKLKEQISEVQGRLDLPDADKQIAVEAYEKAHRLNYSQTYEIFEYFKTNNSYYRAFQYTEGSNQKNQTLYNQIHNYVTRELRNKLKRSLGFFLKADRTYPQKGFPRDRIFSFDQIIQPEYTWNLAFNTSEIQYNDMFEYLVQQRYHYLRELGNYHHRKAKGMSVEPTPPLDPLIPYEKLLNELFPDYKFVDKEEAIPTNLFIRIPSGEVIIFNDLSSGEKEVFFILSFFIRYNIENAILIVDEPELHLHPELGRLLIKTMQRIKKGNQIWLATHNSEIIDEAGRDNLIYITRDLETRKSKIVLGRNEEEIIQELKSFFGYSGYIGIAKNFVFLEGDFSSADRKFFLSLFPGLTSNIKFVPYTSSNNAERINASVLSILESNLGWMNFYLIRDRDYLTADQIKKFQNHKSGKIFVLNKHEIENYLLIDEVIAKVQTEIFGKLITTEEVNNKLKKCALSISAEVLRDMLSFRLNLLFQPEDFSLGKILNNHSIFDLSNNLDSSNISILESHIKSVCKTNGDSLAQRIDPPNLAILVKDCVTEIEASIKNNTWKDIFPGKSLLLTYSRLEGLGSEIVLQNSIIKELSNTPHLIDIELINLMKKFQ